MNKKRFLVIFISILMAITGILPVCAGPSDLDSLAPRIVALEKEMENLKISELSLKEINLKIDQKDFDLRRDYDWLKNHGLPIGIAGLLSFFLALSLSAYNIILALAVKKADQKIDEYLDNEDNRLKKNKRILVLTPTGEDEHFIKTFFRQMGFRVPDYEIADGTNFQFNDVDLIFLNDEKEKMTSDAVHQYATMANVGVSVLYFGTASINRETKELKHFGSVQFKQQIYANLLNALRFQKLL